MLQFFSTVEKSDVSNGLTKKIKIACCLFNNEENREIKRFESFWNGYLRLFNLFQFLPGAIFVTTEGFETRVYEKTRREKPERHPEADLVQRPGGDAASWKEIHELVDPSLHDFLDMLEKWRATLPEAGFELANEIGEVIAEAELAWPELRIGIVGNQQMEFLQTFQSAGWRMFELKDVVGTPDALES
jgi:DEAD/DEAH box helicase domain-containing protein